MIKEVKTAVVISDHLFPLVDAHVLYIDIPVTYTMPLKCDNFVFRKVN